MVSVQCDTSRSEERLSPPTPEKTTPSVAATFPPLPIHGSAAPSKLTLLAPLPFRSCSGEASPKRETMTSTRPSVRRAKSSSTSRSLLPHSSSPTPMPSSPPAASFRPLNMSTAGLPCSKTSQLEQKRPQYVCRMLVNLSRPCFLSSCWSGQPWCSVKTECARTSCWMRSVGGLTSRLEYSTAGPVASFAVLAAGSWVRSMEARIHQPDSSSCRTMRDLSVSTESTFSPLEKDLATLAELTARFPCSPAPLLCVPREPDHALRQPDLPQLLVLLLPQVLVRLRVPIAQLLALPRGFRVVEDNLLVERLVRVAQRRVVDGEEAELRRHHARNRVQTHRCDSWPRAAGELSRRLANETRVIGGCVTPRGAVVRVRAESSGVRRKVMPQSNCTEQPQCLCLGLGLDTKRKKSRNAAQSIPVQLLTAFPQSSHPQRPPESGRTQAFERVQSHATMARAMQCIEIAFQPSASEAQGCDAAQ